MGLGDFIPDPVQRFVDDQVENVGEAIDGAGDFTADRLDDMGWSGGADWLRRTSDSAANALGADVEEMGLDQTEDPKQLVHGSPDKLRATADHLTTFENAFNDVGKGLQGVGPDALDTLKGRSAAAFTRQVSAEPKKWYVAADACGKAAAALREFAETVEWAQKQADEAVRTYRRGRKASEAARAAHHTEPPAAHHTEPPATHHIEPSAAHGPGSADIEAAQDILGEARRQQDTAHLTAQRAVAAARDKAPRKPSYLRRAADGVEGLRLDGSHFVGGVVKGTAGLVDFVRSMNALDPYNLTHPAEYATRLNDTAAGLLRMANDPNTALKAMWDSFEKDPAEGLGRLVPELVGTKGLGGVRSLATAGKDLARTAGRASSRGWRPSSWKWKSGGHAQLEKDGAAPHSAPDSARTHGHTDPVDLATGKMYLPQTDVSLPGLLPLVFQRRAESGYRAGRWFGPSWSSTADQRLEVLDRGVVLVGTDGLLLSYPHPAPGVPTLPELGPRWPLERTPDGDYTVTDPDTGHVRRYTGPADGPPGADGEAPLTEVSDRNGHRLTFTYDTDGTPTGIVHDGGYHLTFTTEGGRIIALRLGDTELVRYGYTDGDLTEVTGSSGLPLRFEYDTDHRVIAWVDTNRRRYEYVYDERDRVVSEGGTEGHVSMCIDYDGAGAGVDPDTGHQVTAVRTPEGHTSRYLVDDRCRIVAVTDPLGNTVRTRSDRHGRPLAHTDALGHTTRYAYDEAGRLARLTTPDGHTRAIARNRLGLPVEITDADGTVWRHTYDERGNRTATTDPAGHTTRYTYDERGALTSVIDPLGGTTRVRCDTAGLPLEITDPLGATTAYHRDAFGRPTAVTDPLGAITRMEWTVEGRLAAHTDPGGARQSWRYDGEGNCVAHTDALGQATSYEHTHFDLVAARTGPDGARVEYAYDTRLRLTRVTDPQGLTWTYEYDPAGRPVSETDFDGRTSSYRYDAAGRLVSRTNPLGQTVDFTRDPMGRIVRKETGGRVTTFGWDPAGRLTSAEGPDAQLAFHRDLMGRVKSELSGGRVLAHTYDALGRPVRRVTPSGALSSFAYDAAGHRTTLKAGGHTIASAYDESGRETSRRIDRAATLAQVWDPAGRLAEQILTSHPRPAEEAATVQRRGYTYRADGHLTGVDDHLRGAHGFELDPAGRVTAVYAPGGRGESYAYDETGNQTYASWPAPFTSHSDATSDATGPRAYTGTRVTRAGRVRYEYDAAGRITLRQRNRLSRKPDTWRYAWDAEDRLTSVTTPDGTVWRYLYDPLGRRTAKQRLAADGETVVERVDFVWDGSTLVEQTTTGQARPEPTTLTWDHDGLRPVAQTERVTDDMGRREIDRRFFAIVTDLVGTPRELLDENGDIVARHHATLWGATGPAAAGEAHTPLRFPGQYHDPETGLHYNRFRYYDPETARYTSPDPLGLAAAPNPVAYVANPHAWVDPLGLCPCTPGTSPTGRPDGETVLSGHGAIWSEDIRPGQEALITVPKGTRLFLYVHHGEILSDKSANLIELGTRPLFPTEIVEPGQRVLDYSLFPPDGLTVMGNPVTVTRETPLSQLLQPNMGNVHWAACREVIW
ncbi:MULTISPECIES: putative T7SS-secreted protein [Streptomyces]|nr:RHS repeat-associated core domain-containing protein [Streptomyces bingchenggensis]